MNDKRSGYDRSVKQLIWDFRLIRNNISAQKIVCGNQNIPDTQNWASYKREEKFSDRFVQLVL